MLDSPTSESVTSFNSDSLAPSCSPFPGCYAINLHQAATIDPAQNTTHCVVFLKVEIKYKSGCGPLLSIVTNPQNFKPLRGDILTIDNDKRQTIYDQFTCIFYSFVASGSRMTRQNQMNAIDNTHNNINSYSGIIFLGNISFNFL